jgi:hypothetical protein
MSESEGREYKIALAGTLPGEQGNGWDDDTLKAELDRDRSRVRYARVAYTVLHTREVTATGKRVLTIQLVRVEPTPDELASIEERQLLDMFERRTGQTTLFAMQDANEEGVAQQQRELYGPGGDDETAGPWPGDPEWRQPE